MFDGAIAGIFSHPWLCFCLQLKNIAKNFLEFFFYFLKCQKRSHETVAADVAGSAGGDRCVRLWWVWWIFFGFLEFFNFLKYF
jgi:hypothetical protein